MKLNVLISTIDDRISQVKNVLLPPREDVEYIVSHQYTTEKYKRTPSELLKRKDVTVSHIEGRGVSRSRNNAIRLASGDIGLFADDDVTYRGHYFDSLKNTFETIPDLDIALFKIKTGPGEPEYKNYPDYQIELKKKLFFASTVEIAFNITKLKNSGIYFDERFGVGRELLIGAEETIFLEDCLKKGFKVMYVPEYVVEHPYKSTVNSIPRYDKRKISVTGAYDCRTNGSVALLKSFLGTIKLLPVLIKNKVNPFTYFYYRFSAALYILRTNKENNKSTLKEYFFA